MIPQTLFNTNARVAAAAFCAVMTSSTLLAQPGRGPTAVVVAPVAERNLPASMRLVGTVLPNRTAIVAAEVSGVVAEFPATEGRFLKRGEVICAVDAHTAELRLAEAQARLGSLQKQLEELENGTRKEILEQLKAAAEEAQAIYDKWEFELKRVQDLWERHQGSEKEKHDTEMERLAARQRLSRATAAYQVSLKGPRKEELARARFDVAEQQAVVDRLERDVSKTKIAAPFDGFVVTKRTEVGEWIASGGPVCEMVALETVKVRADVPESVVPYASAGSAARLQIDALDLSIEAPISRLIPRAAEAARTFPVEIDLPNADHRILPGMFVWTYVPAGPSGKRMMVHKDAIVARGGSKQLFVIRENPAGEQMAMPLSVETGLEAGDEIEVRGAALRPGDLVVVRANERLFGPTPVTTKLLERAAAPPAMTDRSRVEPAPQPEKTNGS